MNEMPLVALAGNPNVGKSTVFNALTGLHQHTGNWPGKTVEAARGICKWGKRPFLLMDVPGAYSLRAQSGEEEAALEALAFSGMEAVIVVCDASCLERNLHLAYQIMEITPRVVVCVNLMDEAEKRGIRVDLSALSRRMGVPAVGICARKKQGLSRLIGEVERVLLESPRPHRVAFGETIENAARELAASFSLSSMENRFAALRLLEKDPCFRRLMEKHGCLGEREEEAILRAGEMLVPEGLAALFAEKIYEEAEKTAAAVLVKEKEAAARRWDEALTHPLFGGLSLLLLLSLVFFITLKGANAPSAWLERGFERLGLIFREGLEKGNIPPFLRGILMEGIYATLARVIAVMLPPMAIFFPLFTMLEDLGYLPRIAFLLDRCFEKCHACGKQALTMCMGFGCNAVGVMGCRIIDSPRERMIAMLTNSLMPCNGRFPLLIAMITLFCPGGGWLSALMLTGLVLLAAGITLLLSRLLSMTLLRGLPSSYTLELPPYRMPEPGKVILRSVLDRTLYVLGRAAAVAAPAGGILYLLSSCRVEGTSLLLHLARFLDPLGKRMGMDGAVLTGFLLGFPANELVLPLVITVYTAGQALGESGASMGEIFLLQGWNGLTALNVMLFSLFHFPCATTLLTFHREAKNGKWTAVAFLLPTLLGVSLCMLTTFFANFL